MYINHPLFLEDMEQVSRYINLPCNSVVLITGATGLIGSFIVDALLYYNRTRNSSIHVIGSGRNFERLQSRFDKEISKDQLTLIQRDAMEAIPVEEHYDYIIHLASNADPRSYALYPMETITTNVLGTINILNYAKAHPDTRGVIASTFEVYGNIPEVNQFVENSYGLIDFNSIRSGYPESKRTVELLVRSCVEEYNVNIMIARLSSIYGPTMTSGDNKAVAQFIRKAVKQENIVLKSKGEQVRSYTYVSDAVAGIFKILQKGQAGEPYNISNPDSVATIAKVAETAAWIAGTQVTYELPDDLEIKGFSKPQNSVLNANRLLDLGYIPEHNLQNGLFRTIQMLRE